MTIEECKYYRVYFQIEQGEVMEELDDDEDEFDVINFGATYYTTSIEKAMEDCMLDYHIPKIDIYDWEIIDEYREPDRE